MQSGKARSNLHGLCSIALGCLCMTMLLVMSPVHESTPVVTQTAVSEGVLQPGKSLGLELKGGAKELFEVAASEGTLLRFSIEKGDLALTAVVYGPTGTELVRHVSEEFEVVELSVPADVSGTYRIEIQSREKENTARHYEVKMDASMPITPAGRKDSDARYALANAGFLRSKWEQASLRQSTAEYDNAASIWTSLGNFGSAS